MYSKRPLRSAQIWQSSLAVVDLEIRTASQKDSEENYIESYGQRNRKAGWRERYRRRNGLGFPLKTRNRVTEEDKKKQVVENHRSTIQPCLFSIEYVAQLYLGSAIRTLHTKHTIVDTIHTVELHIPPYGGIFRWL